MSVKALGLPKLAFPSTDRGGAGAGAARDAAESESFDAALSKAAQPKPREAKAASEQKASGTPNRQAGAARKSRRDEDQPQAKEHDPEHPTNAEKAAKSPHPDEAKAQSDSGAAGETKDGKSGDEKPAKAQATPQTGGQGDGSPVNPQGNVQAAAQATAQAIAADSQKAQISAAKDASAVSAQDAKGALSGVSAQTDTDTPVQGQAVKAPAPGSGAATTHAQGHDSTSADAAKPDETAKAAAPAAAPVAPVVAHSATDLAATSAPAAHNPTPDKVGAAQATPVPLPDPTPADTDPNVSRVVRGLHGVLQQNGGTMTLRLTPPELGVVRIQMDIQNGVVNARFQTEHESVRDLLTHEMGQLRHALESQGLSVDRLAVQTGAASAPQASSEQAGDDGRSRGQFFAQQQGGSPDQEAHRDRGQETRGGTFDQQLRVNMVA